MDIGMLHFVDTQADMDLVLEGGMLDYARKLKQEGVIRAVGMVPRSGHGAEDDRNRFD